VNPTAVSPAELDAARLILARMGITPTALLDGEGGRAPTPTFAVYVPQVSAAVTDGTRRVYGAYGNRVLDQWAERRIDEVIPPS
jgi:integrase/recombinase XerC